MSYKCVQPSSTPGTNIHALVYCIVGYLKDSHGASLVGISNHLLADQTRVGGGNGGNPGLDLKSKEVQ